MIPKPHTHYVMIKTSRQQERERREKSGILYIPNSAVYMTRNLQHGEIVGIGDKAKQFFPELENGQTLLVHHFVQAENEANAKDEHLVHQDEEFNYYVVTVYEIAGKNSEAYATVTKDGRIIASPVYVLMDYVQPFNENTDVNDEDALQRNMHVSTGGIITFKDWKESREDKEEKMEKMKIEIENLSKSGNEKDHIRKGILDRQAQMDRISSDLNKREFVKYTVAAFHPSLADEFDEDLKVGSTIYVLNMAAQTTISFMGKEYRVVPAKINYLGGITRSESMVES